MANKKVPASALALKLDNQLLELEKTRRRMDKLFSEKIIFKRDLDFVYESMFLKAVTAFEHYLEVLFIGSLYGKYNYETRKKIPKVDLINKAIANEIVLNGNMYIDWLPYDKTEKRSKVFFQNNPWSILTPAQKGVLSQIICIRNAIAHKSPYAEKNFITKVVNITGGLPDSNKTPASFLRYKFRRGPDQTKFENFVFEISSIAHTISNYS